MSDPGDARRAGISRRGMLSGLAAAAGGGAAASLVGAQVLRHGDARRSAAATPAIDPGTQQVAFHGAHQPGIVTEPQAHSVFCAYDLRPGTSADDLRRLLRVLTDDIARMMAGRPALGDTAPALALRPSRLTVAVGLGPASFDAIGRSSSRPPGLQPLPAFPQIDRLESRWSDGDLLLHICGDDPMVVAHAQRMLLKDTRAFAAPRWFQRGFVQARGGEPGGTGRNLMGQLDGTVNPRGDEQLDEHVWMQGPGWWAGGTTAVIRRIRLDLDRWDALDRSAMEAVIGRQLASGAPLGARAEHDEPDFDALDATGLRAIPDFAHIRRARGGDRAPSVLRRPYNYDDSPAADGSSDLGLIFCSYQADVAAQYVPIQARLAEADLLNQWSTPVGSAVFLMLPGCREGGFLGERLLG